MCCVKTGCYRLLLNRITFRNTVYFPVSNAELKVQVSVKMPIPDNT